MIAPEVELATVERRQYGYSKSDRHEYSLRRGGSDSTVTRTCIATGEAFLVPERNFLEQGRYYNCFSRKCIEDEKVADRFVVVVKRSNIRGAKEPCC